MIQRKKENEASTKSGRGAYNSLEVMDSTQVLSSYPPVLENPKRSGEGIGMVTFQPTNHTTADNHGINLSHTENRRMYYQADVI